LSTEQGAKTKPHCRSKPSKGLAQKIIILGAEKKITQEMEDIMKAVIDRFGQKHSPIVEAAQQRNGTVK